MLPSEVKENTQKNFSRDKVVQEYLTSPRGKRNQPLKLMTLAATLMASKTGKHQIQWQQRESISVVSLRVTEEFNQLVKKNLKRDMETQY